MNSEFDYDLIIFILISVRNFRPGSSRGVPGEKGESGESLRQKFKMVVLLRALSTFGLPGRAARGEFPGETEIPDKNSDKQENIRNSKISMFLFSVFNLRVQLE